MEKTSIAIVSSIYDCPMPAYYESMLNLLSKPFPHKLIYKPDYQGADIRRARNCLASWFLNKTEAEWCLMIDPDIQFTGEDILRLMSRGKKIIGGLYKKRLPNGVYVLNTLDLKPFDPAKAEVQQVRHVGTGFMLIHRSALELMKTEDPSIMYHSAPEEAGGTCYDFFSSGVRNHQYLSEDWGFCQRWTDCGGQIFVDCKKLNHYGRIAY